MEKRVSRKVNSYTKEKIMEIVRKVCVSYETGEFTLESCCLNAGVPYRTYKDWWTRYKAGPGNKESKWHFLAEVAGLWEQAQNLHRESNEEALVCKAESFLLKSVTGYEYEVAITIYQQTIDTLGNEILKPVGIRKHKKFHPPSINAIIFVLTKLRPEVYNRKEARENIFMTSHYCGRSLEEIEKEIELLKE